MPLPTLLSPPRRGRLHPVRSASVFAPLLALGLTLGSPGPAAAVAADQGLWLHVAVDDSRDESVRVTVPLSLARAIIPLIKDEDISGGKVRLHFDDGDTIDLRALREAVATTKDGEFVRVRADGEEVEVARAGSSLLLRAEDGDEKVRVRVPMKFVDVVLAAEPEGDGEIDLVAMLDALGEHGAGEIVSVEDGDSVVRIWLDTNPDSR